VPGEDPPRALLLIRESMTESREGIDYAVRVSARARRVTLRIAPPEGLVVVVPRDFSRGKIPSIIEERRTWIEKTLARVLPDKNAGPDVPLPERCFLPALQTCLDLEEKDFLTRLRSIAQERLVPWAWSLSRDAGLNPASISIRNQRTIWGSCNAQGRISLNQKLLFLKPHLVRYVILHELCHLEYRNHSALFWSFLEQVDPACKAHRKEIRSAQWSVPPWAY